MNGGMLIMMKGGWYKVPGKLMNDPEITKADIMCFAYVADRLKGSIGAVSVRSVQVATELSLRQCQISLHRLVQKGYLHAQERPGACTLYAETLTKSGRVAEALDGSEEVTAG